MTAAHTLPPELTIYTAGETRTACMSWLSASNDEVLGVDGSAVAEVDGAGIQLLAALARSLRAQDRRLHVGSPSQPLRNACNGLGFADLLEESAT